MDDLSNVFGNTLLNYLLAQDIASIDEQEIIPEQRHIVDMLRGWLNETAGQHAFAQRMNLISFLLMHIPDSATSLANAVRLSCGGQLPDIPSTTDAVLNLLQHVGRDIYAGFLLPAVNGHPGSSSTSLTGPIIHHPQIDDLARAVYDDHELKRLFPGDYSNIDQAAPNALLLGLNSEMIFSSGHGSTRQLLGLIHCIFTSAYYRMLLTGSFSGESYLSMLRTILFEVRHLAAGQACDIPVIIGLSSIRLQPNTTLALPWGTLHSSDKIDAALLPPEANVDALIVTMRPYKLLHVAQFKPQSGPGDLFTYHERYRAQINAWAAETERTANLARLAFLLASPNEGAFAVQFISRTVLDPCEFTPPTAWKGGQGFVPSPIVDLGTDALSRVQHWAKQTKDHPKQLDIAMRRTLAAIADRVDPLDGFIDAVMAWENMFSGRPETNLRVCGAIAWLLEPDHYEHRHRLFDELKSLYTKRSKLVHGADDTVPDPARCRDRAVWIAVECMKRLYSDDSLLRIRDSADRGGMILLGAVNGGAGELSV